MTAAGTTPVYFVRHALAGHREHWGGPDHVRPLDSEGRRQAEALVDLFENQPFSHLVSSPYVRCVETFEPLARVRGLEIEIADELEEGVAVDPTFELILRSAGDGPVAMSTHGDIVENVLDRLATLDVPLTGPVAFEKGSTWVLEVGDGCVLGARYLPPPF